MSKTLLKPQDCVLLIKLIANPNRNWSHRQLATSLFISTYEINHAIKRLVQSNLLRKDKESASRLIPILASAKEYLIHGIKYSFPAKLGEYSPGVRTSYAAPIFEGKIVLGNDPIPVWPYAKGDAKGLALIPLYSTVPQAVCEQPDKSFYDLLTLTDAIRQGRARERNIAVKLLTERLSYENK